MVHGELIKSGKVQPLTYRQVKRLEKMDAIKDRNHQLLELAKSGVIAGGEAAKGLFSNQIAGTAAFALLMIGAYGWGPTRTLIENLSQGVAYGASQGWKSSIAPALADIPGIGVFIPPDNQTNPTPPPAGQPMTCVTQYTYLKYSPFFGWSRGWNNDVTAALNRWDTFNLLDLVGNLVKVTTCVDADGYGTRAYDVIKYAPGHSDIDNPSNSSFNIPGAPPTRPSQLIGPPSPHGLP